MDTRPDISVVEMPCSKISTSSSSMQRENSGGKGKLSVSSSTADTVHCPGWSRDGEPPATHKGSAQPHHYMSPQYDKEVQNHDTALTKPMIRGSDCAYSIHAESFATVAVAELVLLIGHV